MRQTFERQRLRLPMGADLPHPGVDLQVLVQTQRRQAGRARQRVGGIGVAVHQLHHLRRSGHERFVDGAADDDAAHGHRAVGQAFGHGHQVRGNAKHLRGEVVAHAPKTGDHFVKDQQHAMLRAQLAQALQVADRGRIHAAGTGDRLDNDGGHRAGVLDVQQLRQRFRIAGAVIRLSGAKAHAGVIR